MRLIDADALLKDFEARQELINSGEESCDCFHNNAYELSTEWWCVEDAVLAAPTIEAEPVRHGRWEDVSMDTVCSVCGTKFTDEMYWIQGDYMYPKRCPECGAKMDAKEDDHE